MVPKLSKIARNGQISEFTGSRLDQSKRNFKARLFQLEKMPKNDNMIQKKHESVVFFEKKSLRSKMPHPKLVKNEILDIVPLNLIKFNYL